MQTWGRRFRCSFLIDLLRGRRRGGGPLGVSGGSLPPSLPAQVCRLGPGSCPRGGLSGLGFMKYECVCVCVCNVWCVYVCVFPGRVEQMALRPRPEASLLIYCLWKSPSVMKCLRARGGQTSRAQGTMCPPSCVLSRVCAHTSAWACLCPLACVWGIAVRASPCVRLCALACTRICVLVCV